MRPCITQICSVKLSLNVIYPDEYPDVLPELSLEHEEDEIDEAETEKLIRGMKTVVCTPHDLHSHPDCSRTL